MSRTLLPTLALLVLLAAPAAAQHDHHAGPEPHPGGSAQGDTAPTGQAAFAALADVVARLEADSATDWSRVNLEALRQHLIDMNDVVLGAAVRQEAVPGGARLDVTGTGRTRDAIRRMLAAHATQLDAMPEYAARAEELPEGMRLTVTAEGADLRLERKIRGLGFAGLLTVGAHHAEHHLMLARGAMPPGHHH